MPLTFAGEAFLVLGLGKTGQAAMRALEKVGAEVFSWDDASKKNDIPWSRLRAIICSPGIPSLWPRPHPVIAEARQRFVPIFSDVDILRQLAPQSRFIAITGTNGKSTTTAWLGEVLQDCAVGGNIGLPALDLPFDKNTHNCYALELSSYQLEISQYPLYDISVLLNITPDHLTRHGGMEGYVTAKRRIFLNPRGVAIVGVDDPHGRRLAQYLAQDPERVIVPISGERVPEGGIGWQGGHLIDARTQETHLLQEDVLQGAHNQQNCAAVYAAAVSCGLSPTQVKQRLKAFKGLAHRQEHVATWQNVIFINDSKATNANSVLLALRRFSGTYWITGGRQKEDGITALTPFFPSIKKAFLIGEAAVPFSHVLQDAYVPFEIVHTLERATRAAFLAAKEHATPAAPQVVLFSPACASFDQFRDFEERGTFFKQCVQQIQETSYDVCA
jgi:UDP-N-acetylmuramoylalanine--D-glutamate ligase